MECINPKLKRNKETTTGQAFAWLAKGSDPKATIPVLRGIRVSVSGGILRAESTDLDGWRRFKVPSASSDSIGGVFDAKSVAVASKGGAEPIFEGERIRFGGITLAPFAESQDFPTAPARENPEYLGEFTESMRERIEFVSICSSREEGRFQIPGILWGNEALVATDGHRLAHSPGYAPAKPILLPNRFLASLAIMPGARIVLAPETKDSVSVLRAEATIGRFRFVSIFRSLDLKFPDYRKVLAKEMRHSFLVDSKACLASLATVSAVLKKNGPQAIRFEIAEGTMYLSTKEEDASAFASLPVCGEGSVRIGLNASYMREAFSSFGTDSVRIEITDENTHALLSAGNRKVLVMPMNV